MHVYTAFSPTSIARKLMIPIQWNFLQSRKIKKRVDLIKDLFSPMVKFLFEILIESLNYLWNLEDVSGQWMPHHDTVLLNNVFRSIQVSTFLFMFWSQQVYRIIIFWITSLFLKIFLLSIGVKEHSLVQHTKNRTFQIENLYLLKAIKTSYKLIATHKVYWVFTQGQTLCYSTEYLKAIS